MYTFTKSKSDITNQARFDDFLEINILTKSECSGILGGTWSIHFLFNALANLSNQIDPSFLILFSNNSTPKPILLKGK
jgi:hypothetical protein